MTLEARIADHAADLGTQPVTGTYLHLLKRNLIDSYGGICASLADRELIETFKRYAGSVADDSGAEVWGAGRKAQLVHAVFMNTILGRRSDLVNTYLSPNHPSGNHPSDNVSLLLTLGGRTGLDGRGFMQAMHLAYILSCAFSDYYCPEGGNFDHDAAAGFYTALIAGHLLGLDRDGLAEAQRMAGAMGFSPNQAALGAVTDWKHCTYASCAMRGVTAALMARAGFHGPKDIYQGQAGADCFFPHADEFLSSPPDLTTITFKRWPALVFCQTPIDVALDLAPGLAGTDPATITAVDAWTYGMALKQAGFEAAYRPDTRAGRTHSLPYCIAAALLFGKIDRASFDDRTATGRELQRLMGKITLHEDRGMSADYPVRAGCRIRITTAAGQAFEARRDHPRGAPQDPLGDDEITDKTLAHLGALVPEKDAAAIVERLWDIENQPGVGWLLAPLAQEIRT